ncbi:MAG: DUF1275 domain-containing protein [Candidatus Eremiobacteraeota bacterium]|nr:DUF1275 domain-containing protein [Candidatus Eremiobacteraeota bacterium]
MKYLLLLLTVVAGTVDAVSYLALGHVFVVNMTGNVVFLGFAAAGAPGVSLDATVIALAAFVIGSAVGGRIGRRLGTRHARLLVVATTLKLALVAGALLAALGHAEPLGGTPRDLVIALLALAMGIQNATARLIGYPDLTTTVLTMTLTAIGADSPLGGGTTVRLGRRLGSLAAMLIGAFGGALILIHLGIKAALGATLILLALTTFASYRFVPEPETAAT